MPNPLKSLTDAHLARMWRNAAISEYVTNHQEAGKSREEAHAYAEADANRIEQVFIESMERFGYEALSRAPIAEGGGDGEYSQGVMGDGAAEKHEGATRRRNSHFKGDGLMPAYHETHDAPHCPTCDCGVESLSRQGGDSRCPHCDDTGDVHTADGEWHGVCSCPAGDKIGKDAPPKTRASEAGDCPDWKGLLLAIVTERPKRCRNHHGDAPGHSHSIPGVWDSDNGILAGKECAWCKAWREAETYLAIAAAPASGGG